MRKRWIALVMAAVMSVPAGLLAAGTQNKITYDMNNSPINGTYKEPSKSGAKFLGWATTKEKADAGTVDFNATPEDKTNASLNGIGSGQTKTVYAVWQEGNAKYAVALYGIDQDTEKMGGGTYTHTMTFGPATGAHAWKYVTSHKDAHIALSAETADDKCIHNHSWDEIIALCRTNPHVFDKCVESGCTKTVNLDINDTLKGGGWKDDYMSKETGDGPSLLHNELHDEFRVWQPGTGSGDFQYGDNTGGYPASRIRAVLNGYDWTSDGSHGNTTDLTRANQKYVFTRSDESSNTGWDWRTADLTDISTVTSDNCLLSCFPENLQAAIVPKAVKSDTVYNDVSGNNVTTWDKLWLFSGKEMWVDSGSDNDAIRSNEGTIYDRITKQGITTSSHAGNQGYHFYTSGSTASGNKDFWWLRAAGRDSRDHACNVYYFGGGDSIRAGTGAYAVAPGFVLGK